MGERERDFPLLRNQLHIHCYYLAVTILLLHMGCLCVHVQALSLSLDVYINYKNFLVYLFGQRIEIVLDNKEKIFSSLIFKDDSCDSSYSHLESQENSVLL